MQTGLPLFTLPVLDPEGLPRGGDSGRLIDALLGEQGDLTAVERFSQFHADAIDPLQERYYSALLPGKPPGQGQQYAFEVDLDRCSGCKACVVACHSLNGLDEEEAWRDVGLIVGGTGALPILQHVTTACHHCVDPACLSACPVDAYEKDPVTGIVKHLDDQCFGCQYCTLACPYDVPKYNPAKGIVRKCDMCSDRLKDGEAPACVQACPHEAIRIRVVDIAEVVAIADASGFLPTAPDPGYTLPTTRYKTSRPLQGAVRAGDHFRNEPEHAHLPLVLMLVLTQASAGGFLADAIGRATGALVSPILPALALGLCLAGIAASLLHLGRPLYAYRAVIGLRHSWLSREVLAFGVFMKLALVYIGLLVARPSWLHVGPSLMGLLSGAVVFSGLAGVVCSIMVYHVVRRPFWRAGPGGTKFLSTALVLGLATTLVAALAGTQVFDPVTLRRLTAAVIAAVVFKLGFEATILTHLHDPRLTPLRRTALLICGPLGKVSLLRLGLGVAGGLIVPGFLFVTAGGIGPKFLPGIAAAALTLLLLGEFAERYLFFSAVVKPKMPGSVSS